MADNPNIPPRISSLAPRASDAAPTTEDDPAERDRQLEELKGKIVSHKASIVSLNALVDPKAWEQEIDVIEMERMREDTMLRKRRLQARSGQLSQENLDAAVRRAERNRAQAEETKAALTNQLGRLTQILEGNKLMQAQSNEREIVMARLEHLVVQSVRKHYLPSGQRPSDGQRAFRTMLITEHQSKNPAGGGLWCPAIKRYLDSTLVVAAHIFPWKLGDELMRLIFGQDAPHEVFSARNGLMLAKKVEQVFDKFLVAIVPKAGDDAGAFQLIVDRSLYNQTVYEVGDPLTYGQLHNSELEFKGKARPARRYLYWHFTMCLIKASQNNALQFWILSAGEFGQKCWATPQGSEKYITKNGLRAYVHAVGHKEPEEFGIAGHVRTDEGYTIEHVAAGELLRQDFERRLARC